MRQADRFDNWLDKHMMKGGADMPGRLVTAMALLERLREKPILNVSAHVAESGMQLEDHNRFAAMALDRFGITSPVSEWGRRSSNLHGWIGPLFEWLELSGYNSASGKEKEVILLEAQSLAAQRLDAINQGNPLIACYNLSLIHISEPTDRTRSRMPSSA